VIGVPILSKEVLAQRINDYQKWVEAFAGNHQIPIEWGEKGIRKEDYVLPWLRRMRDRAVATDGQPDLGTLRHATPYANGGKLGTVIDQIEHGHHVFRAYWKNAFLKQYEKFSTLLCNELCSNNLSDFSLRKGLQNLNAVRSKFLRITDRFAGLQAQWLNVHVDFALLQRLALPIVTGSVYCGCKDP
jgi:hypothetical protein